MKSTPAQIKLMQSCPFSYTTWGDKVMSRPYKGFSRATQMALETKGLVKSSRAEFSQTNVQITANGKSVLAATKSKVKNG